MRFLARPRQWANRDDGRFYRVGNGPLGAVEAAGLLIGVGAVASWQFHVDAGLGIRWVLGAGGIGLPLAIVGDAGDNHDPHTWPSVRAEGAAARFQHRVRLTP